jgi:hypothetical protein
MANVYYSHPSNRLGILRAVLSTEEGRCLLDKHPAQYLGQQFPTTRQDPRPDFAVLRIFEGEVSKQCRAGFYLLEEDIMLVEAEVHSCDATQSHSAV